MHFVVTTFADHTSEIMQGSSIEDVAQQYLLPGVLVERFTPDVITIHDRSTHERLIEVRKAVHQDVSPCSRAQPDLFDSLK